MQNQRWPLVTAAFITVCVCESVCWKELIELYACTEQQVLFGSNSCWGGLTHQLFTSHDQYACSAGITMMSSPWQLFHYSLFLTIHVAIILVVIYPYYHHHLMPSPWQLLHHTQSNFVIAINPVLASYSNTLWRRRTHTHAWSPSPSPTAQRDATVYIPTIQTKWLLRSQMGRHEWQVV